MAETNTTREIEALAADIGDKVYIDVAKWHLYLSDAHLHTTVAENVYPLLEEGSIDENRVLEALRGIPVKLGGGRKELSLADLVPVQCQMDLIDLLETRQRERR